MTQAITTTNDRSTHWLRRYYGIRAAFSIVWVIAAWPLGTSISPWAIFLLVIYPLWDATANVWDGGRNVGLSKNVTQTFNAVVSTIVAIAVGMAALTNTHGAFYVFGAWAFLAGILQLATAVRRWRGLSAQWPMILSGAQSAAAGVHFIVRAINGMTASPRDIAPYAAFGAFYFAISAIALTVAFIRQRGVVVAN